MKTLFRFSLAMIVLGLLAMGAALASPIVPPSALRPAQTRTAEALASASASTSAPVSLPAAAPTESGSATTWIRRPLGVYAHLDFSEFMRAQKKADHSITPAQLEAQLISVMQSLLANPAISGLALGVHWSLVNPYPPMTTAAPYDWSYLDDAFNQVATWNTKNPTQTPKTIQLIVTAGFNSPQWVLDQIPSCDGLFHSPPQNPTSNCGKATFTGYAEPADGDILPLPWNPTYKSAFKTFLMALAARYGSNSTLVSISVAGPSAASDEMFLPDDTNSANPQTQFGADISPDDMWLKLLAFQYPNQPAYQNTDQAFIDEWDNAIDMYGQIFRGVTLVALPAAGGANGGGLPVFSPNYPPPPANDQLFSDGDCSAPDMSCAAVTIILTHFIDPSVGGANGKATQTSGLKAYNPKVNLGIPSVKLLSGLTAALAPSAQILGGEQYDHPFSTDSTFEGCLTRQCSSSISPEQAEYNVLRAFFDGTPTASTFGGTPGSAPLNYLQDNYADIQYADANVNTPAQVTEADGTKVMMTAQDLLNLASQKLLQIAETNRAS